MMKKPRRLKPWVLYLPTNFQANPLGLAVAVLFFLVGLAYVLTGGAAGSIASLLGNPLMVRAWGFALCMATAILATGIFTVNLETEKLGLRLLTLTSGIFGVWLALAVGLAGVATVSMCILVVIFCQLRISIIKQLQDPWVPPPTIEGSEYHGD
jgi:hypothetical protein